MDAALPILAACVFVAFTAEALAGFGATVIALTLGANFFPIPELLVILVPLNIAVTGYIVLRHRAHVHLRILLRHVLPYMAAGAAIGVAIAARVEGPALKQALGVLVVAFAARELYRARGGTAATEPRKSGGAEGPAAAHLPRWSPPVVLAAGVVHGIYASGGPLLVYAIGGAGLDRRTFRSTLATVWCTLNLGLVATFALGGKLAPAALGRAALLVPVVLAAIAAGEWAHDRIDERRFRLVVFGLLLAAGGALLIR